MRSCSRQWTKNGKHTCALVRGHDGTHICRTCDTSLSRKSKKPAVMDQEEAEKRLVECFRRYGEYRRAKGKKDSMKALLENFLILPHAWDSFGGAPWTS